LLTTSSLYAPKSKLITLDNRQIKKVPHDQTQPFKIKRSGKKWKKIISKGIYKLVEQKTPDKIESIFNDIEIYCNKKEKESLIFNKREGALEIALRCDCNNNVFPTVLEYACFLNKEITKRKMNEFYYLNRLVIKNDYQSLRFLSQMEIFYDPFKRQKRRSPIGKAVKIKVPGALILEKLLSNEINKHYYSHHPDETYQILSKKIDVAALLPLAVSGENIDAVKVLLNYGADPAARNSMNQTSIEIAAVMNTQKSNNDMLDLLLSALVQQYPGDDVKNILNQNRIFLDKKHTVLGNPLHRAVLDRNLGAVELLLKSGADPVALNSRNQTSIDIATIMNTQMAGLNRNLGAVELLLDCGADLVAPNGRNKTSIDIAVVMNTQKSNNAMLALLLSDLVQKYPGDYVKNILNQSGISLNKEHTISGTLLHRMVLDRNLGAVALLLNCGADPAALNSRNQTPINITARLNSKVGREIFDLLFERRFG